MPGFDLTRLRRTTGDERLVRGVAGGLARQIGVDPVVVRLAFVLLTVASGIGLVVYVVAAFVLPEGEDDVEAGASSGEPLVGVVLVTIGLLLLTRRIGLFLPDEVVWPASVIVIGAAVGWWQIGGRAGVTENGRAVVARVVVGALLVAVGIGIFVALNDRIVLASQVLLAALVTTGGVVLLAGPWIVRLGRQLRSERAERIRADERAEVAAHLHDSVLQTLALIQRRAHEPTETIALARRQERELRDWLYGRDRSDPVPGGSLAAELRSLADDVESDHAITVDVVVVGDSPVDGNGAALLAAVRESVVNAAKHSGAPTVSVYGEIGGDLLRAYVRDRGAGFDPSTVPDDRRGLRDSVRGRLERHGGEATIWSSPGEGTEVILEVPRSEVSA